MRALFAFLAIIAGYGWFRSAAHAQSPVDCYLPDGPLDCATLGTSVSIEQAPRQSLRVRVLVLPNSYRYRVELGAEEAYELDVDGGTPADVALLRFVEELRRRCSSSGAVQPVDALTLSPGGSFGYARAGELEVIEVEGGAMVSFSRLRYRLLANGEVGYRSFRIPNGEQSLKANFLTSGASVVAAWTLDDSWSIAALINERTAPHQNIELQIGGGLGFEWVLHPFVQAEGINFALRYRVVGYYDSLGGKNLEGDTDLWIPTHSVYGAVRWHNDRVDLDLSADIRTILHRPEFWQAQVGAKTSLRLAQGLRLTFDVEGTFRGTVPHEPADLGELPNGYGLIGGGDFGDFSLETSVGLSFTLGDTAAAARDQRWKL